MSSFKREPLDGAVEEGTALRREGSDSLVSEKVAEQVEQTPIPFGLNRWLHLSLGMMLVVIWGPLVINWGELTGMFLKHKDYLWVCDGSEENRQISRSEGGDDTCIYQEAIFGQIGILATGSFFLGAFIAGCILDHYGPRVVAVLGGVLMTTSYLMLSLASEKRKTYYAYGVTQGLAVEFVFYSVFTIPNLFPGRRALVLSLLAMARSASMLFCLLFHHITSDKYTPNHVGYTFLAVSGLLLVAAFFLLPSRPYLVVDHEGRPVLSKHKVDKKADYRLWANTLTQPFYVIWLFTDAVLFTRAQFHIVSLPTQHPKVATAFGILAGVGFVFCPPIGWLVDRFSALPVIFGLNCFGVVGFICLLAGKNIAAQWIGVVCISVVLSFIGSQNYALIQERFVDRLCGKLSGLITCFGGIFSFTNLPIWDWAKLNDKMKPADIIFLCYSAVCVCLIILLWIGPAFLFKSVCFPDQPGGLLPPPGEMTKNDNKSFASELTQGSNHRSPDHNVV